MRISDWSSDVCSSDLVAMSNCGALGWTSDRRGYRYARDDPDSGLPWPAMPAAFERLAAAAAAEAGFDGFVPDACLVNRYVPRSEARRVGKESVRPCRPRWWTSH